MTNLQPELKERILVPTISPKKGLYVRGKVRSLDIPLLVDTGTTDTIISTEVYYRIPPERRPRLETESIKMFQVDGTPIDTLGVAQIKVKVGRTIFPVRAVFAKVSAQGILGMDFLIPTGGVLDFKSLELVLHGEHIKCTSRLGTSLCARIVVARTTVIPPGHEAVIPGRMDKSFDSYHVGVIEPVEGGGVVADKGLIIARSLVNMDGETLPLRVLNQDDRSVSFDVG